MADNGKSKDKSKSSLFGGKTLAKKESKKRMTKTQQKIHDSKSSSAENVPENIPETVNGVEGNTQNLELEAKENSKAKTTTSNQNESNSLKEEICNNKEVCEDPKDNGKANTEHSLMNEPMESKEANITRDGDCELSENIASADSDKQQNSAIVDDVAIEKYVEISREQTEDAKCEKQIESDVENKGNEIMTTGDLSKKHGKATSGPLASFRRHRKKSKIPKLSQDAEGPSEDPSEGGIREKKEESVTEIQEVGKESEKSKAKVVVDLDKDKTEMDTLDSAGNMKEIKEASETTAIATVKETSEEKRITKRHKEKRSGPFASFRKSKKKDSGKQQSESSKNEENKPENTNETPENTKENVSDIPERKEENIVKRDKETTEIKQTDTARENFSPENDNLNSTNTAEEKIVLNEGQITEEKNTEKTKKGKRFSSFATFSRTKKAPKISEQTAPSSSPQINSEEQIVTQEQGQIKTDQSTTVKVLQDESTSENKVEEIAPAEISKEKQIGSETRAPEISTETAKEDQLQGDIGPNQEKKKGGLKKRIGKIKLSGGKSKENKTKDNQIEESAQNQTELQLPEQKLEAGSDENEVSLQVKRKKSGGLQKKISKALKRNKSEQLELNEPYDDPSASEEKFEPLSENKSPISTSTTEPAEGTTEKDVKQDEPVKQTPEIVPEGTTQTDVKQDEPVKQTPEIVPEVVDVVFENEQIQSDEKFPSSIADADVKRVTFSLDEEKQSEKPEDPHVQPENLSPELEQETSENIVDGDASREEDSVTIEEKESVPTINEIKPEEDSQTFKAASDLQQNEVVSDIQKVDHETLTVSSVALSLESLESTGTVVLLASTESELTRVSPIPGMFEPINECTELSTEEKQVEERVENDSVVKEEKIVEQQHDENTEFELPKDNLESSEPVTEKVNSQENVEESAVGSEAMEHENKSTSSDEEVNLNSSEAEEVDPTAETEKSIEKNLEKSLESSIQNFLSQNAKEEWILVKPKLEISQEMSHQVKALALESYAHRPACCKLM